MIAAIYSAEKVREHVANCIEPRETKGLIVCVLAALVSKQYSCAWGSLRGAKQFATPLLVVSNVTLPVSTEPENQNRVYSHLLSNCISPTTEH